jgi:putative ABC transport system permease protein
MMHDLPQDIRYAMRTMVRNPGFTATVVLVLALGIGANSALFGIVDAAVLRPLPYPESERIVSVSMLGGDGSDIGRVDEPSAQVLARSPLRAFDAIAISSGAGANLTGGSAPERVSGARISGTFFDVMGVAPALGRSFTSDELLKNGPPAVILSDGIWKRDFGADPTVLGRVVQLDDRGYTVVGVMPDGYRYPNQAEFWLPLVAAEPGGGGFRFVDVIGRLKPDVGVGAGLAELESVRRQHAGELPPIVGVTRLHAVTLHERAYGDLRPALLILLGTVGCVLLIACANVANLLLARAASRRREFALRTALGASRTRLMRQLLVESAALALLGGALGLLIPFYGLPLVVALGPAELQSVQGVALNGQVVLFTLAVALGTGLIFGCAPAFSLASGELETALRESGAARLGSGRVGPRRLLVAVELALAVMLLVGAGLLVKSFARFRGVDPGFDPAGVVTATISLPLPRYESAAARDQFFRELMSRARTIPGVESAALSSVTPLRGFEMTRLRDPANPMSRGLPVPQLVISTVGSQYFRVFGIRVLEGREFNEGDEASTKPVTIISESLARAAFPGRGAVGERLSFGGAEGYTVVGVVADARQLPGSAEPYPAMYSPTLHSEPLRYASISLRVRAGTDPTTIVPALRSALQEADPSQPLSRVTTMESIFRESMAPRQFNMILLGSFAALACVLASIGLYGVIAFLVTQRTREIGLRMALGAEARQVLLAIMRDGLLLALVGVAAGLAASLALSRVVEGMLFQVTRHDPIVFVSVPILLLAVAALATALPARRASRVDPATALRAE